MRVRKCRNSLYGRQLPSVVSRVGGVYDPDSLTCLIFDPAKIESSRFVLCSAFLPNFAQYGFLLAFSPASLTLPFIFDFGVKIARTLCVFFTVLISVGHLPYPRGFSTKNGERLCVSVSFTEGCAAVVACLLRLKSTLHGVPFAPFSVGVGCLPCPELSFSKSLTQGLLIEPDIQFSIFACSFGYSRKEKY